MYGSHDAGNGGSKFSDQPHEGHKHEVTRSDLDRTIDSLTLSLCAHLWFGAVNVGQMPDSTKRRDNLSISIGKASLSIMPGEQTAIKTEVSFSVDMSLLFSYYNPIVVEGVVDELRLTHPVEEPEVYGFSSLAMFCLACCV